MALVHKAKPLSGGSAKTSFNILAHSSYTFSMNGLKNSDTLTLTVTRSTGGGSLGYIVYGAAVDSTDPYRTGHEALTVLSSQNLRAGDTIDIDLTGYDRWAVRCVYGSGTVSGDYHFVLIEN